MLNQVTRALSALFRPIATRQSSEDRDPTGNAYENLHQPKKEKEESSSQGEPGPTAAPLPQEQDSQLQAIAPPQSGEKEVSESELERRKNAIASSQAWVGLVTELEEQKATLGEQAKVSGAGAYEKANTSSSRAARAKKGVILDKKAA